MPTTARGPKKSPAFNKRAINLTVNGQAHDLQLGGGSGNVEPSHTLSHTLRETLGLTGTKVSCDHGACGSCTVLIDGEPRLSCMTLTVECDGRTITTIEGLAELGRRARSPPAVLHRSHRLSMRVLHPGHDPERPGPAQRKPRPHRRPGQESPVRPFLPLHQPLPGGPGGQGRGP